jgi:hypothetical protein
MTRTERKLALCLLVIIALSLTVLFALFFLNPSL